jgi:hypothetical protein
MTPTEFEKLAAEYTRWEKHLGTQKVTTGAFAYEHHDLVSAVNGLQPNSDAFGRVRVSSPFTLFDGKTLGSDSPRYWSDLELSGGGTSSTHSTNRASTTLGVSATTAGMRVRRTYRHFPYTPGKSQLALLTFVHGALASGITRRVGLFTDKNGLFLNTDGTDVGFTRRTYASGSAVDNTVLQVDWNVDPMDGNGPSGVTLDLTKSQILVIDYEWLGVGRVRFGFNVDGVTFWAHEFLNANNLDVVYTSSPNLPLCYELENDGTGAASSLECICSTVISEGGEDPIGMSFGIAGGAIKTGMNGTGSTRYCLGGLRIAAANSEFGVIQPKSLNVLGTTVNDVFAWEMVLDPVIAGVVTWTAVPQSVTEHFDGNNSNTCTGGQIIATGVGSSQSLITFDPQDLQGPGIGADGTPQVLAFVLRPFSNMSVVGAFNWVEL